MNMLIEEKIEKRNRMLDHTNKMVRDLLSSVQQATQDASMLITTNNHDITHLASGKLVTMNATTSASSTSLSSTSSRETSRNIPILTLKLPQASPTRCSTSSPSHDMCVSVPVAASAPSPSMLVMTVRVVFTCFDSSAKHSSCHVQIVVPASSPTLANGDYSINLSAKSTRC
ncbi:hypothetical protein BS78_06G063300 [Paspalum vaginatum]|nr:hypothetical protein BS78_06G063300 [Paspalum vaginatum]